MARLSRLSRTRSPRVLPWVLLGQAAIVLKDHWQAISSKDRARLAELLKASKGRPLHLTPQQRSELSAILRRADIPGLGRDLAPIASRRALNRRKGLRRI